MRGDASPGSSGGHLPADVYAVVTDSVPILCVDVVPRFDDDPTRPYLLISRYDDKGEVGWCWVGGRVRIDERLGDAVARHLQQTLGSGVRAQEQDWSRPELAVDFVRSGRADRPRDARKHSVSLAWIVDCEGDAKASDEALSCERFGPDSLPPDGEFAFGLGPVIRGLLARDRARGTTSER